VAAVERVHRIRVGPCAGFGGPVPPPARCRPFVAMCLSARGQMPVLPPGLLVRIGFAGRRSALAALPGWLLPFAQGRSPCSCRPHRKRRSRSNTNHRNSKRQRRWVPNAPRWRCAVVAHRLCAVDYLIGKSPGVAAVAVEVWRFRSPSMKRPSSELRPASQLHVALLLAAGIIQVLRDPLDALRRLAQ
jgi:hypothetical protein